MMRQNAEQNMGDQRMDDFLRDEVERVTSNLRTRLTELEQDARESGQRRKQCIPSTLRETARAALIDHWEREGFRVPPRQTRSFMFLWELSEYPDELRKQFGIEENASGIVDALRRACKELRFSQKRTYALMEGGLRDYREWVRLHPTTLSQPASEIAKMRAILRRQ
jgi:hypothetical protein